MGKVAGEQAAAFASRNPRPTNAPLSDQAEAAAAGWLALRDQGGSESMASIRQELAATMEKGVGIYRDQETMENTRQTIDTLKERYLAMDMKDGSAVFNTEWLGAIELGFLLDIGEVMVNSAIARKESRGSHQRMDGEEQGWTARDDANYLKHTLAHQSVNGAPQITYQDVVITRSEPAKRAYGAEGEA